MEKQSDLLLPKDVAKHLKIAVSTVYKWAKSGILPCVPLGTRAVRFRPESLEKYVNKQERVAYGKVA